MAKSVPCVALFVDRAQATSPDFELTEANVAAVTALCRRLEGLPLAIELAAARAGVPTPAQILAQLDRGFGVLTSREEGVAERHQSLRAAMEWSYRLLVPELQRFFRTLTVFRGGWSLEAAEAVSGEPMALDFLEQLRESSLIRVEHPRAETRFRMLETLREFGRALQSEEERAIVARRHAEHCLAWVEHAREESRQGRDKDVWNERIEIEHDNLRDAMDWGAEGQEPAEIALRIAAALGWFWELRGYYSEGRARLARLLALADPSPCSARAWALRHAGTLAWRQSDYGAARALLDECLAMQRGLDDLRGVVAALHILGAVTCSQGQFSASREFGVLALEVARALDDTSHIAIALHNLAHVAKVQGDFDEAEPLYAESLALFREMDDRFDVAYALHGLGLIAQYRGDWARARACLAECLAIRRELEHRQGIAEALDQLATLARDQGDYETARDCLEETLGAPVPPADRAAHDARLASLGMNSACIRGNRALDRWPADST